MTSEQAIAYEKVRKEEIALREVEHRVRTGNPSDYGNKTISYSDLQLIGKLADEAIKLKIAAI